MAMRKKKEPTPPKLVQETKTIKAVTHVQHAAKSTQHAATKLVRKYPKTSALAAGYGIGVTHSAWAHSNPEFYDRTPNKGRSEDRHPYGGQY